MLEVNFLNKFFSQSLLDAKSYHIDAPKVAIKLDQNESPFDWPEGFKKLVLDRVAKMPWNRYPQPFAEDLVEKLASNLGCLPNQILLGPGSNYLIAVMMQALTQQLNGELIIARPSFALYETHANYLGLKYRTWDLDKNFEYDCNLLSNIKPFSLIIFASPNNPVGNVLSKADFVKLLSQNPSSIFVADEAYFEFHDENFIDLIDKFPNLILVRTFSKDLGAAGIRCGYIVAQKEFINQFKKLGVPYLLNYFSLAACYVALTDSSAKEYFLKIIQDSIKERERVYSQLKPYCDQKNIFLKQSHSNSLLLKWNNSEGSDAAFKFLLSKEILVRNVSKGPGLTGCLRLSIGNYSENSKLIQAFLDSGTDLQTQH